MENTEQSTNRIQIGAKLDPDVLAAVEQIRVEEDRSMSNMIERLLKTHPQVLPLLEGRAVEVSA